MPRAVRAYDAVRQSRASLQCGLDSPQMGHQPQQTQLDLFPAQRWRLKMSVCGCDGNGGVGVGHDREMQELKSGG